MSHDELIIDRLADEFEAAWQANRRPDLLQFVQKVGPALICQLAELLVLNDIEYRIVPIY